MMGIREIPLSWFIRLSGLVMVVAAGWTLVTSGLFGGWFSTPGIIAGFPVGTGLLLYQRWARWPAIAFYGYWLALAVLLAVTGRSMESWIFLAGAAICSIPTIWKWEDDDDVIFERH